MKNRITSHNITNLEPNQIFVFGSNLSGRHGKGAAKTAMKWGAKYAIGNGLQGRTYGIPTKGANVKYSLSISKIEKFITEFIEFAKNNQNLTFLVTEIGCGLAGFNPEEIAILFKSAIDIENIHLPLSFWKILLIK